MRSCGVRGSAPLIIRSNFAVPPLDERRGSITPTVRRLEPHEWRLYRDLRLCALSDAPDAFGSTFARENAFADDVWLNRLSAASNSPWDLPMVAEDEEGPIGLAWVRIESDRAATATLYQVWVDPAHRRHGVGNMLLDVAVEWAAAANASHLVLSVALGQQTALPFYKRAGFVEVGDPSPLRIDSAIDQQLMRRDL